MIDLHLHLDGSLNAEQVRTLAKMSKTELPVRDLPGLEKLLTVSPGCTSLAEYLEKFELPLSVLQTEETISEAVAMLTETLAEEGLCYGEIRFAPQLHMQRGLTQRQIVEAAAEGLQRGSRKTQMPAQLILCCMRGEDNDRENRDTVQAAAEYLGKGICGLDLAGNEGAYPTSGYKALFAMASEANIPFVIHAGEAAGAESVKWAVEFGARRIGHGLRALECERTTALLRDRKIPLELCYTSNLQTKAANSPETYPLRRFMEEGVRVTVNTDNMTVSGTTLKQEYRLLGIQQRLDRGILKGLALSAAEAAFLPEEEKEKLKAVIERKFYSWLGDKWEK